MTLEEILQIEAQNVDCIFLYQEEGAWYAYEHSAFIVILFWAYLISTGCLAPMESLPGRKQSGYVFPNRISFCVLLCYV